MAEPSGEYSVACTLDLSPVFGKLETRDKVTITQPPDDILDQRLAELESDDQEVRIQAAYDLYYFEKDGDRVFPALVALFEHSDESVRMAALSGMRGFPEHLEKRMDLFLPILKDHASKENLLQYTAYLVSVYAPLDEMIEKVLEEAVAMHADSSVGENLERYLSRYRRRMERKAEEERS